MRGRKPKPAHLRLVDGRTHHGSAEEIAPQIVIDGELGGPPDWFRPEHRLMWDHLQRSAPRGMLTELDRQLIIDYCMTAVAYNECAQQVAESGVVVEAPKKKTPMVSPFWYEMKAAGDRLGKIGDRVGLSPVARGRVKAPSAKSRSTSTFAKLKALKIPERR